MTVSPAVDDLSAARGRPGGPAAPLRAETEAMLAAVNRLDLDALRELVADDFGIVDVDPTGAAVVLDDQPAWDAYMTGQMGAMRAAGARLSSEILDYSAVSGVDMAYSVVRFRQNVTLPGPPEQALSTTCIATIVWRREPGAPWREARWHCTPLPPGAESGPEPGPGQRSPDTST